MLQDAVLAVYIRDGAAAARRVGETGIVGHQAEVIVGDFDLAKIHRPHGTVGDLDVVTLAGAVVRHRQTIVTIGLGLTVLRRLRLLGQTLAPFITPTPSRRPAVPFPNSFR